ncbi:BEACH domain-containing protein lvsA, partial [Austrofundulus limnaeus]|uniref:BEACH domain-containing protein lvsA n=1 Tax=Austrofundulus limnaeus TaxID=52670 RepID=A0A2I4BDA5_AUSLI
QPRVKAHRPDISKISQTRDHLIVFPGTPGEPQPRVKAHQSPSVQQHVQTAVLSPSPSSSSERRLASRSKSQLPVPSSRGQQTRAPAAVSNNNQSPVQTPPSSSSRRTKQVPSSSSNNNNRRNNMNDSSQSHRDIWILHRDLHESNNNQ